MKEFIEIPFGAKDGELECWEYNIPEGYTARIENGKIIVKKEESEDEKIRKEILEYFQQFENEKLRGVDISNWIGWLEKQGKNNMGISEATKQKLEDNLNKALEKETHESWNEFLDKQCEQNPVNETDEEIVEALKDISILDMIEPKFIAGDWIVFNGLTLHVEDVVKGFYRTISKGGITNSYDWSIDNAARLWTIRDLVDGDVITDGNFIGIFKDNSYNPSDKSGCMFLYCSFDMNNGKFYTESGGYDPNYFYPATNEQRDLLFQKMKEAGYKWV